MTAYLVRKKIMMPDMTAMPMNFSLLLQRQSRTVLCDLYRELGNRKGAEQQTSRCLLECAAPNDKRALSDNKQIEPCQSQASEDYKRSRIQGHCNSCDGENYDQIIDFEIKGILAKSASSLHNQHTTHSPPANSSTPESSTRLTSARFVGLAKELRSTISVHGFLCITSVGQIA